MKKSPNYQNLKFKFLLAALCLIKLYSVAQTNEKFKLENILNYYKIEKKSIDGIDFLIYKTDTLPKPTILFIRGSDFIPFFVNGNLYAFPFDIYNYSKKINFVIISKPSIPIADDSIQNKFLNGAFRQGYYIDNKGEVPSSYTTNNNLNYYVQSHNTVINYLNKQSWVDQKNIFVIGSSQGANVATSLALINKSIKKIVLLSPGGDRFSEAIRKVRTDETLNMISSTTAQHKVDSIYTRYAELLNNKLENGKFFDNNTYFSYASFTFPTMKSKLLLLKQPTLIIYGTNSIQDAGFDYLPLELLENNKKNILVKPYIGYDHNFFKNEYNDNGELIKRSFNWDSVMNDAVNWLTTN